MQETKILFSKDFYEKHLSTINNVHFTNREIDVIACLLSARRTSKTAFFLSIHPRTVETHIRNIMLKLGCNTREGIIDFIETSDKTSLLRNYYSLLRVNILFEQSLKDISKLIRDTNLNCFLMTEKEKDSLIIHLRSHLALVGIAVSTSAKKRERDYVICVLPNIITKDEVSPFLKKAIHGSRKTLFLLQERENRTEIPQMLKDLDVIDFAKKENYYFSFFLLLKKLLPDLNFDEISAKFKDKYKVIYPNSEHPHVTSNERKLDNRFVHQISRRCILAMMLVFFAFSGSLLVFYWSQGNEILSFRSDLAIPTNAVRLDRPELIHQIDENLKKQDAIQTVALVGAGGAGKTTLARQYAHQQKAKIIWEINAETQESLKSSFEQLAQALAKTEEDKKVLREIEAIKDSEKREESILQFTKDHLKLCTNWFLIYDNVEKFTDINEYFPYDKNVWGQGKILLTTRDNTIQNSIYIPYAIVIGELTLPQKLSFFQQIMNQGNINPLTSLQQEETVAFLNQIPSFPLDVLIAAHYLKTTNISYNNYLERLNKNNKNFNNAQKNILQDVNGYKKTRYGIVTLSIKNLIETHEDFLNLLLLISLIDSQNIPRDLLDKHKNDAVVDNFIYNLKKYSLITNEQPPSSSLGATFSIHRSTQAISLSYLTAKLGLENNKTLIQPINQSIEDYVIDLTNKEDYPTLKILLSHYETILGHQNLLTDIMKESLKSDLGCIYFHLGDYKKSKNILEEKLIRSNKNSQKFARELICLGNIYSVLGNYDKAIEFIKESIAIYQKQIPKSYAGIALALTALGNIYRWAGDFKEAKGLFEKSLEIYNKYEPKSYAGMALSSAYLGNTYRELGDYQRSKNLLEQSLIAYKKFLPDNHIKIAQILMYMGITDRDLHNYENSKRLISKSLLVYKNFYSKNHIDIAWALAHLGIVNNKLGNYKKARDLLEKSLIIYKKHVSENHVGVAWVLLNLGNSYKELGDYKKARELTEKSYLIFKDHYPKDHIDIALASTYLASIYADFRDYKKAKYFLEQSLKTHRTQFGDNNLRTFWALAHLGDVYKREGSHEKARTIFDKCILFYKKHYDNNSIEILRILRHIGEVHLLEGQLQLAEKVLDTVLEAFQKNKHPDIYIVLEDLAEVAHKKSIHFTIKRDLQKAKELKSQSIFYLKQALEIIRTYFSKDSPHLERILLKIKNSEMPLQSEGSSHSS